MAEPLYSSPDSELIHSTNVRRVNKESTGRLEYLEIQANIEDQPRNFLLYSDVLAKYDLLDRAEVALFYQKANQLCRDLIFREYKFAPATMELIGKIWAKSEKYCSYKFQDQ